MRFDDPGGEELLDLPLAPEEDSPPPSVPLAGALRPPEAAEGGAPRSSRGAWWLLLLLPLGGVAGYFLKPDPPLAAVSPEILDFGEIRTGERSPELELAIENCGGERLEVTAIALDAASVEAGFELVADDCRGSQVDRGVRCVLRVAFSPGGRGAWRGLLSIEGEAANLPLRVALAGHGTAPLAVLEPAQLDFGERPVGETAEPRTVTVTNAGSAALEISGWAIRGAHRGDFSLTGDRCSGAVLPPGSSCTSRLSLEPSGPGERQAELALSSDAPEPIAAVRLVGQGLRLSPALAVDRDAIDFGQRIVGRGGAVELAVSNSGNAPLAIRELRLEGDGVVFEMETCTSTSLPAGGRCRVALTLAPGAEGPLAASLEILHDAPGGSLRLPVSGEVLVPRLELDVARLGFGEVPLGRRAPAQRVELRSVGSAPLELTGLAVEGTDREAFLLTADCGAEVLPPGAGCTAQLGFAPRREGLHRSELRIVHSGAREGEVVRLSGVGTVGRLSLDRDRLDFGELAIGHEARETLLLTNSGGGPLEIRGLRLTGLGATGFRALGSCAGRRLAPGGSCSVVVRFSPPATGRYRARLVVEPGSGDARRLSLLGDGTEPRLPELRIVPGELDFGGRRVGESSPIETLAIENPGNGRLVLSGLRLTGRHSDDFRLVPGSCEGAPFVAPGASCTVGVRFEPEAEGRRSARLVVSHNAGTSSAVTVVGLGTVPPSG